MTDLAYGGRLPEWGETRHREHTPLGREGAIDMDLIARAAGWAEEMLGGESPLWLHVRKVVELCGQILPPGAMMPGAAGASRTAGAAGACRSCGPGGAC
ncbi:MAG: hypothetical protein QME87_14355, partial [Bacillota bacterium]|nr:hypothetical protein [Bacillota bacterium]